MLEYMETKGGVFMYAPLYVKTNYSLLSSLIRIDELLEFCLQNNITSVAITDSNLFGMMEFYKKCKNSGIHPVIGLEISLENDNFVLYAKNYKGYQSLIKLSTIQDERTVTLDDIQEHKNEVLGIVSIQYLETFRLLQKILEEVYLGYANKEEEREAKLETKNTVFFRKSQYIHKGQESYLKYLFMIKDGKTIANKVDYHLENLELELDNIYDYSSNEGLFQTLEIAKKCNVEWEKPGLLLPIYDTKGSHSSHEYLVSLAKTGLSRRLKENVSNVYQERLNYELDIIEKMGFSNYFLVVYDFIKYAKKNHILVGPGRGSGAGSLVCYSIGITDLDPIHYDLLFERFLNPERISMPDIDTDFPDVYRDQVIQYVKEKYGDKKVAGIVTFGTLAAKQAIRDVSRVLNIPSYQVDQVSKKIPSVTKLKLKDFYETDIEFRSLIDTDEKLKLMLKIAYQIEGFPRHTSSHAAGIVMCKQDLDEVIPLTKNEGIYLTGFSMEYLEELGLLKMDFLGLKTLTTIMNILEDIEVGENKKIDFNQIPLEDQKVLNLFRNADTTGIFQFESDGMRNFLRNLKPTSFEDIFAAIALFRPGPAINIDSYIRRKNGEEEITYLDPSLEPVLKSTKGIIIYQEQIMQIASIYAGYTLGEADILRRAMSKKKMDVLKNEENRFIKQSVERGHDKETAKEIFDLILNFANYGFNRAHSVAYSLIAYKMAYLKYYYPKYFYSNLLSSVIGGWVKTKQYLNEAKSLGIPILKPCVNRSNKKYTVENDGIRYPLSAIRNVGVVSVDAILSNRKTPYKDIFDFLARTKDSGINRKGIESLIDAGCFDSFGYNHQTLIHNLDSIENYADLIKDLDPEYVLKPEIEVIEEYPKDYLVQKEKELFGLYLSNHPVTSYKAKYDNIIPLNQIQRFHNRKVNVIIMIDRAHTVRTKNGMDMMFLVGSDEYQSIDFTLFPKIHNRYRNLALQSGMIIKVLGRVERRYNTFQIVINELEVLKERGN